MASETGWRWYIATVWGNPDEGAETGDGRVLRLPPGDADPFDAENVRPDGTWARTEIMAAEHWRGSMDYHFDEITEERALGVLRHWVDIGRLERMPEIGPAPEPRVRPVRTEPLSWWQRAAGRNWPGLRRRR